MTICMIADLSEAFSFMRIFTSISNTFPINLPYYISNEDRTTAPCFNWRPPSPPAQQVHGPHDIDPTRNWQTQGNYLHAILI
jgi:hypothetical protein